MTYMSKSARRADSCVLVAFSPSFPGHNFSNRAKVVSIFPFVMGDLCQCIRQTFQRTCIPIPHGVSEVSKKDL